MRALDSVRTGTGPVWSGQLAALRCTPWRQREEGSLRTAARWVAAPCTGLTLPAPRKRQLRGWRLSVCPGVCTVRVPPATAAWMRASRASAAWVTHRPYPHTPTHAHSSSPACLPACLPGCQWNDAPGLHGLCNAAWPASQPNPPETTRCELGPADLTAWWRRAVPCRAVPSGGSLLNPEAREAEDALGQLNPGKSYGGREGHAARQQQRQQHSGYPPTPVVVLGVSGSGRETAWPVDASSSSSSAAASVTASRRQERGQSQAVSVVGLQFGADSREARIKYSRPQVPATAPPRQANPHQPAS